MGAVVGHHGLTDCRTAFWAAIRKSRRTSRRCGRVRSGQVCRGESAEAHLHAVARSDAAEPARIARRGRGERGQWRTPRGDICRRPGNRSARRRDRMAERLMRIPERWLQLGAGKPSHWPRSSSRPTRVHLGWQNLPVELVRFGAVIVDQAPRAASSSLCRPIITSRSHRRDRHSQRPLSAIVAARQPVGASPVSIHPRSSCPTLMIAGAAPL